MQVNMLDAKSRLSQLVQAVLDGEEVILARNGEPVARITRYVPVAGKRNPGALREAIRLGADWDSLRTNRRVSAALAAGAVEPMQESAHAAMEPQSRYRVSGRARSRAR